MPLYDYRCKHCERTWEVQLPISRRDEPLTCMCPCCFSKATEGDAVIERYLPSPPGVGYTTESLRKQTPEGFKDVLRHIKAKHLHSTIDV